MQRSRTRALNSAKISLKRHRFSIDFPTREKRNAGKSEVARDTHVYTV